MEDNNLTYLLEKLSGLIHEKVESLRGVRGELESLKYEVERMRAFLRIAEAMEDKDQELLINQVRNVAEDAEDVLDKFRLHQAEVCENRIHGLLNKIPLLTFFWTRDVVRKTHLASEIKAINSKLGSIIEQYEKFKGHKHSRDHRSSCYDLRGDALLLEEAEVVGIDKAKNQLVEWLVEDDNRFKAVSVVGTGGSGKTTLVKKVYDFVAKEQFTHCAWIHVSERFKIEELLKDMIHQLFAGVNNPAPRGMDTMSGAHLKAIIKEFLRKRQYMIVLDDIWNIDFWNAIQNALPRDNGSRVVLTTRNPEVASAICIGCEGEVYHLELLSDEESLTLFCKKTFQGSACPPHLEKIVNRILIKCGGLPLAIVAISGILANKDTSKIEEWEKVVRNLGAEIEGNGILQSMAKILLLGFNDLPLHLKSCFLYLSIFPEDHPIDCMRLARLWIAEGFVMEMEGNTLEDVAEKYINLLLKRGLIQAAERTSDGRVHSCRIHEFVREIIVSKSREQNFTTIASNDTTLWPERVRRLSIHNTLKKIQQEKSLTQLRSLFMFGVDLTKASISPLIGGNLRLLRVLDLKGALLEVIPDEIFMLYHLRYLSLRDTKVKMLPSSIEKLQDLETLDLKRTSIAELPTEISKLKKLRHILVYHFEKESYVPYPYLEGFKAPLGIGQLRSLQKLCFVDISQASTLDELAKLEQLRRLGITSLRKEDGKVLCSSIEMLSSLRSLNIHSVEEDEIIDMQHMNSPPQFLQRLYLHGRLQKLPDWIARLHSLVKILLRWSQLSDNLVEPLGTLPNLMELQLRRAYNGTQLNFSKGSFPRLKVLLLDELEELNTVELKEESVACLQELTISRCPMLYRVPTGIEYLSQLKLFQLFNMPEVLSKSINRTEYGEDYRKVSHIAKVYASNWKKGHWERSILSGGNMPSGNDEKGKSIQID